MSARHFTQSQGLALQLYAQQYARFQNKDASSFASTFTQAGPMPGRPVASADTDLVLETSGSQSEDGHLAFRVQRGGMPRLSGASIAWRDVDAGHTTSQWRGYDGPGLIVDWFGLDYSATAVASARLQAVRLKSGKVVVAGHQDASPYEHLIYIYTPSTSSWTSVSYDAGDTMTDAGPALCVVPGPGGSERILLLTKADRPAGTFQNLDVHYSDDEGATWGVLARGVLLKGMESFFGGGAGASVLTLEKAAAYSNGTLLLLWAYEHGGIYDFAQYASSDLGASFELVRRSWDSAKTQEARSPCVVATDAGFVVGFWRDDSAGGAGNYVTHRVGNAFSPIDDDEVQIDAGAPEKAEPADLAVSCDEDGTLYAYYLGDNDGSTYVASSNDGGASWAGTVFTVRPSLIKAASTSTVYPSDYAVVATGGRHIMACRWVSSTGGITGTQSIAALSLGGYTAHTAPTVNHLDGLVLVFADDVPWSPLRGVTWGTSIAGSTAYGWIPLDVPSAMGWTAAGAGVEAYSATGETPCLEVTSAGGTGPKTYERSFSVATLGNMYLGCIVQRTSGGAPTSDDIALKGRLSDYDGATPGSATYTYSVEVRVGTSQWGLWDTDAGALVGSAQNYTSGTKLHVRVAVDQSGNVRSWYRTDATTDPIDHHAGWSEGPSGTLQDHAADDVGNRVIWGNHNTADAVSRWYMVGASWAAGSWTPTGDSDIGATWTNPDDLLGCPLGLTPRLVHDGVKLSAIDGPGREGDTFAVEAAYQYPIAAAHVDQIPSPSQPWRTSDTASDIELNWDALDGGAVTTDLESTVLAVAFLGTNIRKATLWGRTGGAWTSLGAIDGGSEWANADFTRRGNTVTPLTTSAAATRPIIYSDEFKGAYLTLTSGATVARAILQNTEGRWEGGASFSGKKPMFRFDGYTGGEAASGDLVVVARNHVSLIYGVTGDYEAFRITITAADNPVPQSYFEGKVLLGRVYGFAPAYSHGWQRRTVPQVTTTTLQTGRRIDTRRGPAIREVEIGWTDPGDTFGIGHGDPDWLAVSAAGTPLATWGVTPLDLHSLIAAMDGPVTPCIWLGRIPYDPAGVVTITDPMAFLYGQITSSPSSETILGWEAVDELVRTSSFVVREIP